MWIQGCNITKETWMTPVLDNVPSTPCGHSERIACFCVPLGKSSVLWLISGKLYYVQVWNCYSSVSENRVSVNQEAKEWILITITLLCKALSSLLITIFCGIACVLYSLSWVPTHLQ